MMTVHLDDNVTQIALAFISLLGIIATGVFSFLSLRYASQAKTQSTANSVALHDMHDAVNGLTRSRVEAEQRVGEAKVAQARAEGRIEEIVRVMPAPPPPPPATPPVEPATPAPPPAPHDE